MKVRLLAYLKELGPYCFRQNSKLWDVAIDISSLKEVADKLEKDKSRNSELLPTEIRQGVSTWLAKSVLP